VFNAPWALLGLGFPPDPVGSLSRFDGTSTQGTWSVLASDQFAIDTGTLNSWSMLVTPVHFTCAPFSATAAVTATKTIAGTFLVGGTVTYTVVLTNGGTASQADNPGNELTDVLPAGLSLVSASATSGTAVASIGTNTVTWNGPLPLLGGSTTVTIVATINAGTAGTVISNQGTVSFDADGNGTNESTVLTDDPAVGGASDSTSFTVGGGASITGTKAVSGRFLSGGAVTYTVVLTNGGVAAQGDNPGNELVDVLPAELELTSASASAGTAVAVIGTRTVTWNGSIAVGASVTITIQATVDPGHEGSTVSNQASVSYDSDANGTNDAAALTDDPAQPGATDPTTFVVLAGSFFTVTPCRLVDTRGPDGPQGGPALVPGQERALPLVGVCNVPATATAVAINVAVTATAAMGHVTLWADGDPEPPTSNLNFVAGQTRANNAVVELGPSGAVRVVSTAGTHVVIDITGYFE
jgi:uncharacterized repeat protein (TIGR01451 family)